MQVNGDVLPGVVRTPSELGQQERAVGACASVGNVWY